MSFTQKVGALPKSSLLSSRESNGSVAKNGLRMAHDEDFHIPILQLWQHCQNLSPLNPLSEDYAHLRTCEFCVAILWLGYRAESIEELEQILKRYDSAA